MAQKVHYTFVDDLDGSEATETISFGYDGTSYEIDLSEGNANAFRAAFADYASHARRVRRGDNRRRGNQDRGDGAGRSDRQETSKIREWARGQGLPVTDRGRLSGDVREKYYAAQARQAGPPVPAAKPAAAEAATATPPESTPTVAPTSTPTSTPPATESQRPDLRAAAAKPAHGRPVFASPTS